MKLSGMIDRLNWDEEKKRYRVIDYKTGSSSRKPKNGAVEAGRTLVRLPMARVGHDQARNRRRESNISRGHPTSKSVEAST